MFQNPQAELPDLLILRLQSRGPDPGESGASFPKMLSRSRAPGRGGWSGFLPAPGTDSLQVHDSARKECFSVDSFTDSLKSIWERGFSWTYSRKFTEGNLLCHGSHRNK